VLACIAHDAQALVMGDARVRSSLGDRLDVRVPITLAPGESIDPSCFTLAREGSPELPRISGARISVERSAAGTLLRIETGAPVTDPAVSLSLVASCRGLAADSRRDYSVLLDPPLAGRAPPSMSPPPAFARAQPEATSIRAIAATLIARIGDTLESIANAIFPRNRAAKSAYLQALRESNPPLASLGDNEPIPIDTPIALPDLRTFARSRSPRATQLAQEDSRPATAPQRAPAPARQSPAATRETPSAARETPTAARPAPPATRLSPATATPPAKVAAPASAPPARRSPPEAAGSAAAR